MKKISLFIIPISLFLFLGLARNVHAATYYIDYDNGNDTYTGTSKDTPWKHAPGMQGCTENDANDNPCRARTHLSTSGDSIIFKGGVTWHHEALPFEWTYGNSTYFGVDKNWYSGTSWSRPIFNNDGYELSLCRSDAGLARLGYGFIARLYGANITVDNLEFTGCYQNSNMNPRILYVGTAAANGGEIKNCYFHGWSHGPVHTDGVTLDEWGHLRNLWSSGADINQPANDSVGVITTGNELDMNFKIHDNVIDGWDTSKDMAAAYFASGAGHFYNNYIANMRNGYTSGFGRYVWGNTFYNIGPTFGVSHGNVMSVSAATIIMYNNFVNIVQNGVGADIFSSPIDGGVDHIFNNVITADSNCSLQIDNNVLTTGAGSGVYVFNNTIQAATENTQATIGGTRVGGLTLPFVTSRNNHLISNHIPITKLVGTPIGTITELNNVETNNADATSAGYLYSNIYPYYPPSSGSATVNQGYNMTSVCNDLTDQVPSFAHTACLHDTTLGVAYDSISHSVIGPKRVAVTRPTTDTWDIGAYEYTSGQQTCTTPGDFTCNGYSISDLQTMINIILKIETTPTKVTQADMNNTKTVDAQDLQILINKVLGIS